MVAVGEGFVQQLYILPGYQGLGIGSTLLEKAIELSPDGLELWAFQQNERARGFYERRGFVAVEFTDVPKAYSILAYGQSAKEDSPHHDDQAALFARGIMKQVSYTREDVERRAERRYRPGLED